MPIARSDANREIIGEKIAEYRFQLYVGQGLGAALAYRTAEIDAEEVSIASIDM